MNSNLYICIRESNKRLKKAIQKQESLFPVKEAWMKYVRVLTPLSEIPLFLSSRYEWYLDGVINNSSKSGAVYSELIDAGIKQDSIWHKGLSRSTTLVKIFRVVSRLYLVLGLLSFRFKQLQRLDLASIQVIIGYTLYKKFFKNHPSIKPIIISDISPFLHMQWVSALAIGRRVMWWQNDYHHFEGFSEENYLPYPCDYAAVLNDYGLRTVLERSPEAHIMARPRISIQPLKKYVESPLIGFASNVLFNASEKQIQYLSQIRERLKINSFLCRLHPNAKLNEPSKLAGWLKIAPREQSLEAYATEIDMALVGNSAVQLKLLCMGVPVIHVPGFDDFGYDLYKYCQNGFIYGQEQIEELNLEAIYKFYQRPEFEKKLRAYVGVSAEIPSLEALP